MIDGKSNDGSKTGIAPYKRNIGAMKGGDKRDIDARISKNLLSHVCNMGMWNGIMNMQNIKTLEGNYIYQFAGKSCLIRGIFKERVIGNRNLVIRHVL